jgi:hypothetical protein
MPGMLIPNRQNDADPTGVSDPDSLSPDLGPSFLAEYPYGFYGQKVKKI